MNPKSVSRVLVYVVLMTTLVACNLGNVNISFATSTPAPTNTPVPPTKTSTPVATPTPAPTRTPIATATPDGLTNPVVANGVDFLFTEIVSQASYQFPTADGMKTLRPVSPFTTLLVVEATTRHTPAHDACWTGTDKVVLSWTKGGKADDSRWGLCVTNDKGDFVRYVFPCITGVEDLAVTLPGGVKVSLDSLPIH